MAVLDKDFQDACRTFTNRVANGVNNLKRSATVTSISSRQEQKDKDKPNHLRCRSSFMALIPPTFTHHSQASISNKGNGNNASMLSRTTSDASIHEGGDFVTNSIIEVHAAKFVEVKRKGGKFESVEMPKPTAKELELYRELETVKKALKTAEDALTKKQITRKAVPTKNAPSSSDAFAVQFPARLDSQAWKLNIGKLKILSVFSRRPTIAAQHRTLSKLNVAGVFLVECEEDEDEDEENTEDSGIEDACHN